MLAWLAKLYFVVEIRFLTQVDYLCFGDVLLLITFA
jgi:hypothetical protein